MGEMINTYKFVVSKPVIVDWKIVFKRFSMNWVRRIQDLINLPEDKDSLQAVVDTKINPRVL
jgi:hypothetical protein